MSRSETLPIQPVPMVQGQIWQIVAFPIHFLVLSELCLVFQHSAAISGVSFTGIGCNPRVVKVKMSNFKRKRINDKSVYRYFEEDLQIIPQQAAA